VGLEHRVGICLPEFRLISTTVGVDIVRLHVLTITKATSGRLSIAVTICMKSRFAKVRRIRAVWQ
jgi:hypothetical protein